jgi:hypothetical protein
MDIQSTDARKNSDAETVNQVTIVKLHDDSDESAGLVVNHVTLSASSFRLLNNSWIVDSGATCHMCNRSELFIEFAQLNQPLHIALGDGHKVDSNWSRCGCSAAETTRW